MGEEENDRGEGRDAKMIFVSGRQKPLRIHLRTAKFLLPLGWPQHGES